MRKFTSTYPISRWQTMHLMNYSVGENVSAAYNHSRPGAEGRLHIGTLSVNSRPYPP